MYRLKVTAFMVIIVGLGIAAFQQFDLPLDPAFYSRSFTRALTNLEKEFGQTGLAALVFVGGIVGLMTFQRRT